MPPPPPPPPSDYDLGKITIKEYELVLIIWLTSIQVGKGPRKKIILNKKYESIVKQIF